MHPLILVVDDEPATRLFLQTFLEDEGYYVGTARDGYEALACIAARTPALILLDLNMPVMDGWELNAHLRAMEMGIPVVFMSAGATTRAEAERHGAAGWLAKPFELETLLGTVKRFTSHRSAGV